MKHNNKIVTTILTMASASTIVLMNSMDLNCTHMTNPLWAPHARFHWSIHLFSMTAANLIALYLLWGRYDGRGSRLSVVIAGIAPILFWGSFFPSMLMPGTSTWPDGMEPFLFVAPQVFMAVIITSLCLLAIYLDARSRVRSVYSVV